MRILTYILILTFIAPVFCISFVSPALAISLDDEEEDMEDFEDYIQQARDKADQENFRAADDFLKKAEKLGVDKTQLKKAKKYVSRKKQEMNERIAAQRRDEERSGTESSSSSSGSSQGLVMSTVDVRVESGGFISLELDHYKVTMRQTNKLNGDYSYFFNKTKSGKKGFFGSPARFYPSYGIYEIEFAGYLRPGKKSFVRAWKNLRIDSKYVHITLYGDGRQPNINAR
ncbi:MAG: hypothetical protein GY749_50820 [Desulfobacteraceae bacterium]|nr:hypothetical protein [Desulfobacteraceae bacterium]